MSDSSETIDDKIGLDQKFIAVIDGKLEKNQNDDQLKYFLRINKTLYNNDIKCLSNYK